MAHMHPHRLRFSKEGRAKYISHLDLMRTFPRAFLRAGLNVKQTEGFNQHSFVSIALPLSLGYTSGCELLEFELLDDIPLEEVPARMNAVLPEGLRVDECYCSELPAKKIAWTDWELELEFDSGVPESAAADFLSLYAAPSLVIEKPSKKAKRGFTEIDLIPMIRDLQLEPAGERMLRLRARLAAQNPGLNPELLITTARALCPDFCPDFVRCRRVEVLDENLQVFR